MAEENTAEVSDYVPESTGTPDVPEVSSTPAVEPAAETVVEPIESDWRENWSEFGDVGQFDSEADWKTHLQQQYAAVPTLRQYAQIGQQVAPHQQDFFQYMAARQRQPAEPVEEPVDPFEKAISEHWKAPEYDQRWDQAVQAGYIVQNPETRMYEPTNPMAAEDARKLNEYRDFEQNQLREFARQGPAMMKPVMEALIEQKFQEYYQGQQSQQQDASQAQEVVQRNSSIFYQVDDQGQFVPNAMGQPQLTPIGERFYAYQEYLRNDPDYRALSPGAIAKTAEMQLRADVMQQVWSQQQATDPAKQGGNGGAAPAKPPAQSFIERAEANASGGASTASPPASPVKWNNDRDMAMTLARNAAAKMGVNIDE